MSSTALAETAMALQPNPAASPLDLVAQLDGLASNEQRAERLMEIFAQYNLKDKQILEMVSFAWNYFCDHKLWRHLANGSLDTCKRILDYPHTIAPALSRWEKLHETKAGLEKAIVTAWGVHPDFLLQQPPTDGHQAVVSRQPGAPLSQKCLQQLHTLCQRCSCVETARELLREAVNTRQAIPYRRKEDRLLPQDVARALKLHNERHLPKPTPLPEGSSGGTRAAPPEPDLIHVSGGDKASNAQGGRAQMQVQIRPRPDATRKRPAPNTTDDGRGEDDQANRTPGTDGEERAAKRRRGNARGRGDEDAPDHAPGAGSDERVGRLGGEGDRRLDEDERSPDSRRSSHQALVETLLAAVATGDRTD